MNVISTRTLSLLLLTTVACGPQFYLRDHAERELRQRASFEMECPSASLQLTPLSSEHATYKGAETDTPKTMGVSGCGKKGTYVYVSEKGYLLNSATNSASAN